MKVLAVSGAGSVIVEMDVIELGRLRGNAVRVDPWNIIGNEYEIVSAWGQLEMLHQNCSELAQTAAKLRAVADLLHPIACEVEQLTDPTTTADSEKGCDV